MTNNKYQLWLFNAGVIALLAAVPAAVFGLDFFHSLAVVILFEVTAPRPAPVYIMDIEKLKDEVKKTEVK